LNDGKEIYCAKITTADRIHDLIAWEMRFRIERKAKGNRVPFELEGH